MDDPSEGSYVHRNDSGTSRVNRWYLFLDESYGKQSDPRRLIVSCVLCRQTPWDERAEWAAKIGAMGGKKRLQAIRKGLPDFGFAILGYADVPAAIALPGAIDGAQDIRKMARMDNLWSILFLSVMTATIARLRGAGLKKARFSIYYDQQSLTSDHRQSIQKTIQENLSRIATEDPETGEPHPELEFTFPVFEEVAKRKKGEEPTPLQHGTAIAHHLCSQLETAVESGTRNFPTEVLEFSDSVLQMIDPYLEGSDPSLATPTPRSGLDNEEV